MSESFDIALIGAGGIARAHRAAAEATDRVRVAAIVDTSETVRAASTLPAFESIEALLTSDAGERIRGAVLCTPPSVRGEAIRPLLEAGKAVLCEKPLARSEEEAAALVDLARKYPHVPTAVGYCHRFTPAVEEMKRRAVAGDLGTLIRFENTFACWHPTMRTSWMSDVQVSGGGSFIDTGCHSLDLFQFLCGNGTVTGAVFHREWEGRGESNATVLLKADSGAAGMIASGWQEPDRFIVTLVGTAGLLSYDYARPTELSWQPSHDAPPQTLSVETHEVRFRRQLEHFASWVEGGAAAEGRGELCNFESARAVARMVDKATAVGSLI